MESWRRTQMNLKQTILNTISPQESHELVTY